MGCADRALGLHGKQWGLYKLLSFTIVSNKFQVSDMLQMFLASVMAQRLLTSNRFIVLHVDRQVNPELDHLWNLRCH